MKIGKAISYLENLRTKLLNSPNHQLPAWRTQATSYIKTFFGDQSPEHQYLNMTLIYSVNDEIANKKQDAIERYKETTSNFISNCIETIKEKGLYHIPKPNFIYYINNQLAVGLLLLVLSGTGTAAYLVGRNISDVKNFDLRIRLKHLEDSLTRFSLTPAVSNNITSKGAKENQKKGA